MREEKKERRKERKKNEKEADGRKEDCGETVM